MDILDLQIGEQPPEPEKPLYEPFLSKYQTDYFDAVRNTGTNIQLDARAGSGKTFTLVRAVSYLPDSLVLAFGRVNKEELAEKCRSTSAKVSTFNGLGHGLFFKNNRSAELDARKVYRHTAEILGTGNELLKEHGYAITRAVSLMKNNAWGIYQGPKETFAIEDISELIDSYGLDVPSDNLPQISSIVNNVWHRQAKDYSTFDYDDQLWVPVSMGWPFRYYANVLVDEDQDLSPIQHIMLEQLASTGSRILGVGDDRQAIYGFRGALTDSVELLRKKFSMTSMPLPICYRCPQAVIREAQAYVPDIQARPDAPEGSVIRQWEIFGKDPEFFGPEELVISRTNAPLFKAILRYVRAKRPCRVETNFLEQFQGFVRGFKCETTAELRPKLDAWRLKEIEAAEKKGFKGKIAQIEDKYETSMLLANEFKRVYEMLSCVEMLSKSPFGTRFSTVHKAKGTEAEDVYILRPDLMPSPFANTKEQMAQEMNLLYVAITRAKSRLTWGMPL
jgi:DNA helicase-2/ATP-dependent DNA helicase PcrA